MERVVMAEEKSQSRISRRAFLGTAGVGVAAGAIIGFSGSLAVGKSQTGALALPKKWDKTADVVVVGAGGSGFVAAVTAASKGSSVIMLEKASIYGGTTAKAGSWWIPNNSIMRKAGLTDPKPDAMKYMVRLSFPTLYDPASPTLGLPQLDYSLIEACYDSGPVMIDAIGALGAPQKPGGWVLAADGTYGGPAPGASTTVDYHAELPEDKAPRGRKLTAVEGGNGAGLIKQLKAIVDKQKTPLLLDHAVTRVFRNGDGQVVGVEAKNGNTTVTVRANKAVIFGSGGFTHNAEMRQNYLRGPMFPSCAVLTNTGDFVNIGIQLGAALGNMNNAWWAQNAFEQTTVNSSVPNDIFMPFGDSMIMVNKYGRRVVNEKQVYNERTQAHFYWDPSRSEYPNLLLFQVWDDHVAKNPNGGGGRDPIPAPGVESPLVVHGATWDELAKNIDTRLAKYVTFTGGLRLDSSFAGTLKDAINRFNGFAASGKDLDFGRGETPIQQIWSGPPSLHNRTGSSPNATMAAFDGGPYHAAILGAGTLDTKGGPRINVKGQVIDTAGKPIPGLYGAGNCIASPAGQAYWSAGGTLGPGMTFGYLAGINASLEPVKPV
jgi:hypothetical protein